MARLLIVDDHVPTLDLLRQVFADEGFEVHVVSSQLEALESVRRLHFDLVLTDLFGVGHSESPLEMLRELCDVAGSTPVAVLTAHSMLSRINSGEHRVAAVIAKPFDLDDLIAQIRSLIGAP